MNLPSKTALFVYPGLVLLIGAASLFVLGPGSMITLVLLIGIITIPLAFAFGSIPTMGLTLALSLPFYFFQIFIWPKKITRSVFLSILLGLGLSAAACQIAAIELTKKGNTLSASDIVHSLDFAGKSIAVLNIGWPDRCGELCEALIFIGGAREVTVLEETFEGALPVKYLGNTFELLPAANNSCDQKFSRGIAQDLRIYHADKGLCVTIKEDNTVIPDIVLVAQDKIKTFYGSDAFGYNPFVEAISATRTSVFALPDGSASKIFQFTAVDIYPPAPILLPVSIAKGPHTGPEEGFIRPKITLKDVPSLVHLLFSEEQRASARSALLSTSHKHRILSLLHEGQLDKYDRSLVWSYANSVLLEGHDRTPVAFEIAGKMIASGEFSSHNLAPKLIDALKPDQNEQWAILSNSLFAVMKYYRDIANKETPQKVWTYMTLIGQEIADLPPNQLPRHKEQLETLANESPTINASYSAFAIVDTLGGQALPILRALFRSAKASFESLDSERASHERIWLTRGYRTAAMSLCNLAKNGDLDQSAIHQLLDDGAVVGDSTFLKAVAFTDFVEFERLTILQNDYYIHSKAPHEIVLEHRGKHPSAPCY